MKYVDADKIKNEIERLKQWVAENDTSDDYKTGVLFGLIALATFLDKQTQEELTPPGVEEQSKNKGWIDYGLTISEIGLHRYNAIHRIREEKEKVEDIQRKIPPAYLARLGNYFEAVGTEITCCCLQAYCKDFVFTEDEVKEIINKES